MWQVSHAMVNTPSLWPSPAQISMHGCELCDGSKFHSRMEWSIDAEARIDGDMGDTVRSWMSCIAR